MARSQQVTSNEYPYLPVRFGIHDHVGEESALLDTGFTGSLAIPASWRTRLGRPDGWGRWRLADGSIIHAPVYLGRVEIIGLPPVQPATIVVVGNEYILGRRVLDRFEITFDHGQRLIVRP
jgi:predicted aspartyl protease